MFSKYMLCNRVEFKFDEHITDKTGNKIQLEMY